MNFCRTCRHWSRDPNFIGAGSCLNLQVRFRLKIWGNDQGLVTAQNFGCVCHEAGEPMARLVPEEEEQAVLQEFVGSLNNPHDRPFP